MFIIDTTCPHVEKTFRLIENEATTSDIYFIGKRNHPESIAAKEISDRVYIYDKETIFNEKIDPNNLKVAYQTTMSFYDIEQTFNDIKTVYPKASIIDMIPSQARDDNIIPLKII